MAGKQEFKVVRGHQGDRWYDEGETRTAEMNDVRHLVPHVLEPMKAKAARSAPKNKAEGAAPANKTPAQPAEN